MHSWFALVAYAQSLFALLLPCDPNSPQRGRHTAAQGNPLGGGAAWRRSPEGVGQLFVAPLQGLRVGHAKTQGDALGFHVAALSGLRAACTCGMDQTGDLCRTTRRVAAGWGVA